MIIAKVLSEVGRIHGAQDLLSSEAVHLIVSLLGNPLVENRLLVVRSLSSRDDAVAPVDGMDIIYTDERRSELDTTLKVARLCYVVITCIVHDTWSGAVALCEGRTAERIHRNCVAGSHIVH